MAIKFANGADDVGAVSDPSVLKSQGFSSGVYKFNTPDGGEQDGYFLNCSGSAQGGDYGWVLIGRFQGGTNTNEPNNEAIAASFKDSIDSVRGLSDVSITGTSRWSADWGHFRPKEIRVISHSSSTDILGNRGVDFIYKTGCGPSGEGPTLWEIMCNWQRDDKKFWLSSSLQDRGVSGPKCGHRFAGARDGRGRWTNNNYDSHRVADTGNNHSLVKPWGWTAPATDMWHWFTISLDSKFSVHAGNSTSGQDTSSSAYVGWDDNNYAHYDANTGSVSDNSARRDFSSSYCVTVWMR
jgi:hypothetical protein